MKTYFKFRQFFSKKMPTISELDSWLKLWDFRASSPRRNRELANMGQSRTYLNVKAFKPKSADAGLKSNLLKTLVIFWIQFHVKIVDSKSKLCGPHTAEKQAKLICQSGFSAAFTTRTNKMRQCQSTDLIRFDSDWPRLRGVSLKFKPLPSFGIVVPCECCWLCNCCFGCGW